MKKLLILILAASLALTGCLSVPKDAQEVAYKGATVKVVPITEKQMAEVAKKFTNAKSQDSGKSKLGDFTITQYQSVSVDRGDVTYSYNEPFEIYQLDGTADESAKIPSGKAYYYESTQHLKVNAVSNKDANGQALSKSERDVFLSMNGIEYKEKIWLFNDSDIRSKMKN